MLSPLLANAAAASSLTAQAGVVSSATALSSLQAARDLGPETASALSRLESGGSTRRTDPPAPPSRPWTQRLASGVAGLLLGALVFSGCKFDPSAPGTGVADASTSDGSGGDGGTSDGDGGTGGDGGTLAMGPSLLRPTMNQVLPGTRAFLLWADGEIPAGRSIADYEICSTTGMASDIDPSTVCPNAATASFLTHHALDIPQAGATYRWKARARFDDGSFSAYSAVQVFTTDASLVGRWLLEDDALDASGLGHDGTLQNGASFAPGLVGQALALDGTNDSMTAADTGDHDFGTGDFWLSAWVHPLRDGAAEALITKRDSGNGYELYRSDAGQLVFFSPTCGNAAMGGNLPTATWRHVAARRTAGTVRIYVDGAMVGMGTCAENFANAGSLTLGTQGPLAGNGEAFQGRIDEVVLRNTGSEEAAVVNEFCADQTAAGVDPLPAACQ